MSTAIFTEFIKEETPFVYTKFGDGEYLAIMISDNKRGNCDGEKYSNELNIELRKSIQYLANREKCFLGKWHHDQNMFDKFDEIKGEKITNWIPYHTIIFDEKTIQNKNIFDLFLEIKNSKKNKIYLGNKLLIKAKYLLNVQKYITINLHGWFVEQFEFIKNEFLDELKKNPDSVILLSGGMGTKVLIKYLHELYPNATYIDVGSCLDFVCTKKDSRCQGRSYEKMENYFREILPENWNDKQFDWIYDEAKREIGIHLINANNNIIEIDKANFDKINSVNLNCDFIEIGTSDFDTCIQNADDDTIGISIEPIKYYLDKLPNKKNCKKICCAVSDDVGFCNVFFIQENKISELGLQQWARGCNSINDYHPTIAKIIKEKNLDFDYVFDENIIEKKPLMNIIDELNVKFIYYLKIDTEGHDVAILNKFIDDLKLRNNNILPHKILFESNSLSNSDDILLIIQSLEKMGYDLVYSTTDTMLELNLKKIKKNNTFSEEIKNYFIYNYPENYDANVLPHENTLEGAKKYCIDNNFTGVVYQDGYYTVRTGDKLYYKKENNLSTFLLL
jgi:hypothetical protein